MIFDPLHHAGDQIAGDADFQRNVAFAQVAHQRLVAHRGDPVADAFGAQCERVPDGFRPHALAGVRVQDAVRHSLANAKTSLNQLGRTALFAAADAECDHALIHALGGEFRHLHRRFHAELPDGIQNPPNLHRRLRCRGADRRRRSARTPAPSTSTTPAATMISA